METKILEREKTLRQCNGSKHVKTAHCQGQRVYINCSCGGVHVYNLDISIPTLCSACYQLTSKTNGMCNNCGAR